VNEKHGDAALDELAPPSFWHRSDVKLAGIPRCHAISLPSFANAVLEGGRLPGVSQLDVI